MWHSIIHNVNYDVSVNSSICKRCIYVVNVQYNDPLSFIW